jgi:hypothetical protein
MALHCTNDDCLKPLDGKRHKRRWCSEECWRKGQEEMRAKIERSKERHPDTSPRRTIQEPDDCPTVTERNWPR